jgi:2-polyprenyl-3-methyl-5-hydroxy-6-metoxy-1,4-benzoquinol methylase
MSQYSENKFVDSENHSWGLLNHYITPGSTVLDVGCSSGSFGKVLIDIKKCIVDGIEPFAADAELARQKLRDVYELNVENGDLSKLKTKYDFIIFADVIEHLVDPVAALQKVTKLLKPGGSILYSLPNMAHISIRLALLDGEFDHTETGLIDKTHLHFYTHKQLERTFTAASLTIADQKYTHVPYPETYILKHLEKAGLTVGDEARFKKLTNNVDAQAFQFVGRAVVSKGKPTIKPITKLPHQKDSSEMEKLLTERMVAINELQQIIRNENDRYAQLEARMAAIDSSKAYRILRKAANVKKRLSGKGRGN